MAKTFRKLPARLRTLPNGERLTCVVERIYQPDELREGALACLGVRYSDGKLISSDVPQIPEVIGPYTRVNRFGKTVKRKDLPMETVHYEQERSITDWHGYEHDVTVSMPYRRYPIETSKARKIAIEVRLEAHEGGSYLVRAQLFGNTVKGSRSWENVLLHRINLMQEVFGHHDVIGEQTGGSVLRFRKLNWRLLPPGEYPFERIVEAIEKQLGNGSDATHIDMSRLAFLASRSPDFQAMGEDEFQGYVVFGFGSTFVLDNIRRGNAIYVFLDDWKILSKKTKKQLLSIDTGKVKRIVHTGDWRARLNAALPKTAASKAPKDSRLLVSAA